MSHIKDNRLIWVKTKLHQMAHIQIAVSTGGDCGKATDTGMEQHIPNY